jgi:glutathione peroxidase
MAIGIAALIGLVGLCSGAKAAGDPGRQAGPEAAMTNVYAFTMRDIDGKDVSLSSYRGKVLLIVNVASKCGFTGQYEGLEKLYKTYKDRGLVILGFPANDFLGQEPGTEGEIKSFCTLTYGVTFPMFAKIAVKGAQIHPLYAFLTSKETNPGFGGAITWNFNKFLVGRDGTVVGRFGSRTRPDDKDLVAAVERALAAQP